MTQGIISMAVVNEALNPLVDGISLALTRRCPVVVHTLWHPLPYTALIPFHLHLCWAGRFNALPLTATCAVVPFLNADSRLVQAPLYQADEANKVRHQARAQRYALKSYLDNDFVHPDWEEGLKKHRAALQERVLPGCSFLSVDTVGQFGQIFRGTRPYLGARVVRSAPRPHILVPAHGALSKEAYAILASADLLVINLQKVRGQNALSVIREVLLTRGSKLPSLIITSSPGDLSAILWNELGLDSTDYFIGTAPSLSDVDVTIIGKDRPQVERDFAFAAVELQGYSPLVDNLLRMATAAWWAGRQNMIQGDREDLSLRRFSAALEQARLESPSEARLLTAAEDLITRTFEDQRLAQERLEAVLDAVLAVPGGKRTLVVTRHRGLAMQLQTAIAAAFGVTNDEVTTSGIMCRGVLELALESNYDYAITCGYFGSATIDAIFASRASKIHMIFDPVEAGIAWHNAHDMARLMQNVKSSGAEQVLQRFCSALYPHLLPFTGVVSLSLEDKLPRQLSELTPSLPEASKRNEQENVIILFVDGTWLEISRTSRLEIIDRQGAVRLRTVLPTELQTGDEMIIVASEARSLFSEYLMHILDTGRLQPLAEKRDTWLTLLNTFISGTHPNLRSVHRGLSTRGVQVSYQTVLSWMRPAMSGDQTIPMRWQHFKSLADELHLVLPETYLAELFNAIRLLRVRHRLAGRNLIRAMRNTYLGRLDNRTLAQIEREWGISARELMQSTRLMEVDSLLF